MAAILMYKNKLKIYFSAETKHRFVYVILVLKWEESIVNYTTSMLLPNCVADSECLALLLRVRKCKV
jgi:hypothetical protein